MDQKQTGTSPVPPAWPGQSATGNALGLPHLQPATMDPTAQTTSRNRLTSSSEREIQKLLAQKTPRLRIRFPNPRSFSARLSKDGFFTASETAKDGAVRSRFSSNRNPWNSAIVSAE